MHDMIGIDRELEVFFIDLEEWEIIEELCRVLKVIIFLLNFTSFIFLKN